MYRQKGITIVELLLGIAIAAVIITISVRYFFTAEENMRVEESIGLIKNITQASFDWRAQQRQPDFDAPEIISIENLLSLGLIHPEEKLNPWGGEITVEPAADPSHIKITLARVPFTACGKIKRILDAAPNSKFNGTCNPKSNIYTGEF